MVLGRSWGSPGGVLDRKYIGLYKFCIGFNKFSTEELRLATGASAPVARKKRGLYKLCIGFKEGILKGMYTAFNIF